MISKDDRTVLRDLAKAYRDLVDSDRNQSNIEKWRNLNNMTADRPLVFCNVSLLGMTSTRSWADVELN